MSRGFDQRSGESSIVDTLQQIVDAGIVEVHTAMPGEVVSFDAATQTASVQICIQREVLDSTDAITQLDEVPMMVMGAGGFSITVPVAAGDPCLVLFMERGLDNWYLDGGCQPPETRRHHHLSDAVFIPGLRPAPSALTAYDTDNLTLRTNDGQTQLCITPNGEFAMTNGTEEVLTIMSELIQTLTTATDIAGQAFSPADVTALTNLRTRLQTLIK